jgi:hypothetical protein
MTEDELEDILDILEIERRLEEAYEASNYEHDLAWLEMDIENL